MKNSMESPQKTENRTTICSSNSTSGYISKGNENRILIPCTPTFTAVLFTIAKRKKQPKCQSVDDERIKKIRGTYTMGRCSAVEKETESLVVMWMDLLESVIQSEVSQKEKDQYCVLKHICGI